MPKYTYQGEMGRVSARTAAGPVVLPKGVEVEITDDQHEALANHPVFTALEKSGELIISEVKKAKPSSKADTAAKAKREAELVEVKAKLTELNVEFSDDESLEDLQAKLAVTK
ncbi:hypothetical protein [Acinetobacter modestus]|uniref:hypothetical protein n=1 Tax=Acinetobacter modestus TaxID=1776740 RepID=UPI001F4A6CD8|nr:hypothetical protein [Acinetobacter modestus]MCH7331843.1 hypothetical protein [Acinetobacter modestus]